MESRVFKLVTKASERIYVKTFLLDDKLTDYLINIHNLDIKVSIHKKLINTNNEFIEILLKNNIPIYTHDEEDEFIIIDNNKFNLKYVKENTNDEKLENIISLNFNNNNLYMSDELLIGYKLDRLVKDIKEEFRLIVFSKSGTKVYMRKINFASVLKKQSKQKVVADEEKFELYDKNFLYNDLKNLKSEEDFNNLKKEYNNLMELCKKYNVFGDNLKTKYLCGKFDRFILVEKNSIDKIIKDIEKINSINKNINENYFNILMDEFYRNFESKLIEVLKRHDIYDNKDVEDFKKKVKDNIPKAKMIKDKIKIDNFMIIELSREMLLDEKIIRKLKSFNISDKIKDKLNELENTIK